MGGGRRRVGGARDCGLRNVEGRRSGIGDAFAGFLEFGLGAGLVLGDIGFEDFDGFGELTVGAGGGVAGLGPDDVVGSGAIEFHVEASAEGVPAAEREAKGADVHDAGGACADHASSSGDADEGASFQVFDRVAEDFGVAEAVLIAENNDGFVPSGIDHPVLRVAGGSAATGDGDGVTWLGKRGEEMVCGGAAAILTDINDEAVFAGTGGIEFLFKSNETGFVHGADVEVAEFAVGSFFDLLSIVFDPLIVKQGAGRAVGDRAECDRALFGVCPANEESDIAFDGAV